MKRSRWIYYNPLTMGEMVDYLKDKNDSNEYLEVLKIFPHKIGEYKLLCGLFGEDVEINYFSTNKMEYLTTYMSFDKNHYENIKIIVDNISPYLEKSEEVG